MRAVLQRVSKAVVSAENKVVGSIDRLGWLILLGIHKNDQLFDAEILAQKIPLVRSFNDASGKMNLSLKEIDGAALVVSQFTLFADTTRGRRPSFKESADPKKALRFYEHFLENLREQDVSVATGAFGKEMIIDSTACGPVTIFLDSRAS